MNCRYPTYKTSGMRNPYYKCLDFYVMTKAPNGGKRIVHRCWLEPYIQEFLEQGFYDRSSPDNDIRDYYDNIVTFMKGAYKILTDWGIMYENLNARDSAVLVIRRALSNIVCEEEMAKIEQLFSLDISKVGKRELRC